MPADFVHLTRPANGDPAGAMVLLHGRGTDEHDLFPLFDAFDPQRRLLGITVRGPLDLPPGGRHWYRLAGIPTPDPSTFESTRASLATWLGALPESTGVPWTSTVLGGFSQGCVMSYALGLGKGRPSPAGILGMSGFVPRVPGFELDLSQRTGLPVMLAHGTLDEVIPVEFGREAAGVFDAAGLQVSFHESPVPHTIDPGFVPTVTDWLARVLPE